jgi:hypothetical protein
LSGGRISLVVDATRDVRVVDGPEERRYELWVGDLRAGVIEYLARGDTIWLLHSEVDRAYEGKGLGRRLVAGALDDIRTRGLRLVPICSFVRAYLTKHPEEDDLVAPVGAQGGSRERAPGEVMAKGDGRAGDDGAA